MKDVQTVGEAKGKAKAIESALAMFDAVMLIFAPLEMVEGADGA